MRSMRVQLRDILLEVGPVVLSVIQKTKASRNLSITIVVNLEFMWTSSCRFEMLILTAPRAVELTLALSCAKKPATAYFSQSIIDKLRTRKERRTYRICDQSLSG